MKTKRAFSILIILVSLFSCKNTEHKKNFQEQLIGQWESVAIEKEDNSYRFKELELTDKSWHLNVLVYNDAIGHTPLFKLEFDGAYEITEASAIREGSFNGAYRINKKFLTLLTRDSNVINMLGFDGCSLEYGIKTDVSNGCSFIESVKECPIDYDLITIKNGMLYPGKRTDNMCAPEGRPTDLGTALKRVEQPSIAKIAAVESKTNFSIKELANNLAFLEGPIWDTENKRLIFSEVNKNRLLQWSEKKGVTTYFEPSNYAGGNVFDKNGNIISCQGGARQVTRINKQGKSEVLISSYDGKRFNSPNDVVVKSDGTIWFTDPDYGLLAIFGEKASDFKEQQTNHIFMYDPITKDVQSVYSNLSKPNGLAFSKDESILYVGNSEVADRKIVSFQVNENNELNKMKLITLIDSKTWGVDGLKIGNDNNLYAACGDGVDIFNPDGKLITKIETDFEITNLCFGEKNELFLTGHKALYRVNLN